MYMYLSTVMTLHAYTHQQHRYPRSQEKCPLCIRKYKVEIYGALSRSALLKRIKGYTTSTFKEAVLASPWYENLTSPCKVLCLGQAGGAGCRRCPVTSLAIRTNRSQYVYNSTSTAGNVQPTVKKKNLNAFRLDLVASHLYA